MIWKYWIISCSCTAWPLISSEVEDSSSEAEAFTWVVCASWVTARLICSRPVFCSREAEAISCTRSAVLRIDGTILSSSSPARAARVTLSPATAPISCAATWLRSASLRTSSATTAKPLPWSPARAASMAAFSASRLVW
ncbi:hypothetical protein D3C78_1378080 [compost metagenome]